MFNCTGYCYRIRIVIFEITGSGMRFLKYLDPDLCALAYLYIFTRAYAKMITPKNGNRILTLANIGHRLY